METSLFFQWINFLLFAGALGYLLRGPLRDFLGNRREGLKREIEEITRERLKIEGVFQEYRKKLAEAGKEIGCLMEDLKKEGEFEKRLLLKKAEEYADKIKNDAVRVGEQEFGKAKLLLRKKALSDAVDHAKNLIEGALSPKDHENLVGSAIQNLKKQERGTRHNEGSHLS